MGLFMSPCAERVASIISAACADIIRVDERRFPPLMVSTAFVMALWKCTLSISYVVSIALSSALEIENNEHRLSATTPYSSFASGSKTS